MTLLSDSGVLPTLLSNQSIADLIIAVIGAFVGAAIALGGALFILRSQIRADKQLAVESRLLEVVHEVARSLLQWAAEINDLKLASDLFILRVPGAAYPEDRVSPTPITIIATNRTLLHDAGLVESTNNVVKAIEIATNYRHQALFTINDVTLRILPNKSAGVIDKSALYLLLSPVLKQKWDKFVTPIVRQLEDFATALYRWQPGDSKPPRFVAPESLNGDMTAEMIALLTGHGFELAPNMAEGILARRVGRPK